MDQQTNLKNQNMNQQPESSLNPEQSKDKMSEEQAFIQRNREQLTACVIPGERKDSSEQVKNLKRTRKTIEQELAELDAKRERLVEKKRKQEAYEKIVFGETIISMLIELKKSDKDKFNIVYTAIKNFITSKNFKYNEIIDRIITNI